MIFDFPVLDFIQEHFQCEFLDRIIPYITMLGNGGFIWITAALIMLCVKRYRYTGIEIAAVLILNLIICNLILKNLAVRERPCWINSDFPLLIDMPKDYSFPSGHTSSSFAAASVIFYRDKRLGIPAFITAFIIAFTRLYLYVHFPTDVIGGALIGIFNAFVIILLSNKFLHTKR